MLLDGPSPGRGYSQLDARLALLTDVLIQQDELSEAADVSDRLHRAGAAPVILAYQKARLRKPQDFGIQLRLLDRALQNGHDDAVQWIVANWKDLEGEEGTFWRYGEAARRVALAQRDGTTDGLEEARRLLAEVAARRPEWPRVPLRQAAIAELEGDPDRALAGYRPAMELGDQRLSVIQRLVQRLYEEQRYAEADQVIRKFPRQGLLPGSFGRLAAQLAVYTQDTKRALALARKAVQDGGTGGQEPFSGDRVSGTGCQQPFSGDENGC